MGICVERLHIDASSTRLFRVGEVLRAGQALGESVGGEIVRPSLDGEVAEIHFDIDSNEVILAIAPIPFVSV